PLDDYIGRMPEGQDAIWYVTADGYRAAAGSPQLEAFRARDIEVLLMSDRIDEWMLGHLREYAGKPLKHVAKGELPLDEAAKNRVGDAAGAAAPLRGRIRRLLGERVGEVKVSARLTASPSCLALAEGEMAPHLAHLLREAGQDVPARKPTLEVNPQHPLLRRLQGEADDTRAGDLAHLLLDQEIGRAHV